MIKQNPIDHVTADNGENSHFWKQCLKLRLTKYVFCYGQRKSINDAQGHQKLARTSLINNQY